MRAMSMRGRWLGLVACVGAATGALADESCETEASWAAPEGQRHFILFGARKDVFYDTSGPSAVILVKVDMAAQKTETGALGVYGDPDGGIAFGAVPPTVYDEFLTEPGEESSDVMLRLEITGPQHERALGIMRTWDRRVRERELLYQDDILLNHFLYLKQVTETLNECAEAFNLYTLDWGIDDYLSSEETITGMIPYLLFAELRQRNESLHVPDADMPREVLLLADAQPAQ